MLSGGVEENLVRMISLLCFTIVGWGALTDIGASLTSLRMVRRTEELEEAYAQLEDLNREMRAQRHDFMNHIQVVYSLIEMNEPGEAMAYMDKIYGDMQRVSRMMRTACPAVNALIQAKVVEAEQRGAEPVSYTHLPSRLSTPPAPSLKMLRRRWRRCGSSIWV